MFSLHRVGMCMCCFILSIGNLGLRTRYRSGGPSATGTKLVVPISAVHVVQNVPISHSNTLNQSTYRYVTTECTNAWKEHPRGRIGWCLGFGPEDQLFVILQQLSFLFNVPRLTVVRTDA